MIFTTFLPVESANDPKFYERIQITGFRPLDAKTGRFVDDQGRKWFPAPLLDA